jgi:hypothetical protein
MYRLRDGYWMAFPTTAMCSKTSDMDGDTYVEDSDFDANLEESRGWCSAIVVHVTEMMGGAPFGRTVHRGYIERVLDFASSAGALVIINEAGSAFRFGESCIQALGSMHDCCL